VKQNPQTVTIETPEHVELQFLLAGIGTRFLAYLVDRSIQVGLLAWVLLAVLVVFGVIGSVEPLMDLLTYLRGALGQWLIALAILAYGVITIGYFILFEYLWSGRTPGKRSQQIRVIRNDGRPVSFLDVALRNILRFVDIVASVYPAGLAFMFVDARNRRLGDLAAGTLVVMERRGADPSVPLIPSEGREIAPELNRIVASMTPEDYHLLVKYLGRKRTLDEGPRQEVARAIGARICRRTGQELDPTADVDTILEDLETVYRNKVRIL
jgi:uncharacterized RDD family membrane protein YckC